MPYRTYRGPIPTLADIRKNTPWVWVWCNNPECFRKAPMALTPLIIRWGMEASSDRLRNSARCVVCGRKGATIQLPSWVDSNVGSQPFPVN